MFSLGNMLHTKEFVRHDDEMFKYSSTVYWPIKTPIIELAWKKWPSILSHAYFYISVTVGAFHLRLYVCVHCTCAHTERCAYMWKWLDLAFGALFKWGTYAALISFRLTTERDRWQTGVPLPKPFSFLITHLLQKVKWTSKAPSGFHVMK